MPASPFITILSRPTGRLGTNWWLHRRHFRDGRAPRVGRVCINWAQLFKQAAARCPSVFVLAVKVPTSDSSCTTRLYTLLIGCEITVIPAAQTLKVSQ